MTVKEFILSQLTDQRFEQVVNKLIEEDVWYHLSDDEILSLIRKYLADTPALYAKPDTFQILEEIQKVSTSYVSDYKQELKAGTLEDLKGLGELSFSWMPGRQSQSEKITRNQIESDLEPVLDGQQEPPLEAGLDWFDEDLDHSTSHVYAGASDKYGAIHQIECLLTSNGDIEFENRIYELNEQNYKRIVDQLKQQTTLALVNFIYEVLHYSNSHKLASVLGNSDDGASYVKVSKHTEKENGYDINIFLEHRSKYLSEETKKIFVKKVNIFSEEGTTYTSSFTMDKFPEINSGYVCYDALIEDLEVSSEYLLAPFTFYMNEEITLPNFDSRLLDDLLFQLIHIFTFHGFTKEDQIKQIMSANQTYEQRLI